MKRKFNLQLFSSLKTIATSLRTSLHSTRSSLSLRPCGIQLAAFQHKTASMLAKQPRTTTTAMVRNMFDLHERAG